MFNNEIWRDIVGFEGYYQISNYGRVKSTKLNKEKIMSLSKDKFGYYKVCLYKEKNRYYKKVHRLVAEAFIFNPYNLPQVNHKDENKTNNCVDNLEWCSLQYNLEYGTGRKRSIEHRKKPVRKYTDDDPIIEIYSSLREASELNNINEANISSCCLGKAKSCGGFKWKYERGDAM